MSLILRPRISASAASGLPLVVALAAAAAIRARTGAQAQIKWPNDVYLDGRKVAGVLGESTVEGSSVLYTVIGIGVNVNQDAVDMPQELQATAASLAMVTGSSWPRVELLAAILQEVESRYREYNRQGFVSLADEFKSYSSLIGRTVEVDQADGTISGTVVDLDPEGALLLATAGGTRSIRVGDAQVRIR